MASTVINNSIINTSGAEPDHYLTILLLIARAGWRTLRRPLLSPPSILKALAPVVTRALSDLLLIVHMQAACLDAPPSLLLNRTVNNWRRRAHAQAIMLGRAQQSCGTPLPWSADEQTVLRQRADRVYQEGVVGRRGEGV